MFTDSKGYALPKTRETPVGVFRYFQSFRTDNPSQFVSYEVARQMRQSGNWYSCNSGKDIAEAAPMREEVPEEMQKSGWRKKASGLPSIGYREVMQLL